MESKNPDVIKVSVIVAFYNNLKYLKLVLAGFENQTFKDFQIILADDGSTMDVVSELEKIISMSSLNIIHIWHEDEGWRKNTILNSAIKKSESNYLIFIDGDCIPHKEFVKEHFENSSVGTCLTGRRVNLSQKITSKLNPEKIKGGYFYRKFFRLIIDGLFGKSFYVEKGFYTKSIILRKLLNKKQRGILGCNFSIHKNDVLEINGFDERYKNPSVGEDSDVQFRLELNNVKIDSLNNIAVQYHLYHKIKHRPQVNLDLFEQVKKENQFFTPFGISKTPTSR